MVICYCRGGDKTALEIWAKTPMKKGLRSDYTPYSNGDEDEGWYFLDWDFATPTGWPRHEQLARTLQPSLVMIPDYFDRAELPTRQLQDHHIRQLGLTVMWTPKFDGALDDIPEDAVIGISVPTTYAGYLPPPEQVAGRRLHLLGGHPDHQAYLMREVYYNSVIASVDGNVAGYKAALGQYWSLRRQCWAHAPKHRFDTAVLAVYSARQICRYLFGRQSEWQFNPRRLKKIHKALSPTPPADAG